MAINNPDSQITQSFDLGNRLTSVSTSSYPNLSAKTILYTYDLNGNRLTMVDALGGVTNYTLDTLNRVISITNPSSQTTSFTYDKLSRQLSRVYPNGDITTFAYESHSRLSEILNSSAGGSTISSYSYTYNKVDNRVTQSEHQGNRTFTYDQLNRLLSTNSTIPVLPDETFSYDPLGNRLTQNGTLDVESKGTGIASKLIYNAENQLERFEELNADGTTKNITTYKYDGLDRRIEKNVNGVVTCYVYDFEDILMEYSNNDILFSRYTHGPGIDNPLIMQRDIDSDQVLDSLFYHTDGLGSITELTDIHGSVVQNYKYDSFGMIVDKTGNIENPYLYTGREYDAESGLYFYRARYYDPTIGRFLQFDPIGFRGGLNPYIYVRNNPFNLTDPDGKGAITTGACVIYLAHEGAKLVKQLNDIIEEVDKIKKQIQELLKICANSEDDLAKIMEQIKELEDSEREKLREHTSVLAKGLVKGAIIGALCAGSKYLPF